MKWCAHANLSAKDYVECTFMPRSPKVETRDPGTDLEGLPDEVCSLVPLDKYCAFGVLCSLLQHVLVSSYTM